MRSVVLSIAHEPKRAPELDAQRPSARFSKSISSFGETGDMRTVPSPTDAAEVPTRPLVKLGVSSWASN